MSVKSALRSARVALDANNYTDALRWCQDALELESNNYHAYVFMGVAQMHLKNFKSSEQAFRDAIVLNPKAPLAHQVKLFFFPPPY